MLEVA
jgi:hypothetical protein